VPLKVLDLYAGGPDVRSRIHVIEDGLHNGIEPKSVISLEDHVVDLLNLPGRSL
jgi:hypothetical protein